MRTSPSLGFFSADWRPVCRWSGGWRNSFFSVFPHALCGVLSALGRDWACHPWWESLCAFWFYSLSVAFCDWKVKKSHYTVDHLAWGSMKNAANCASECELQDTRTSTLWTHIADCGYPPSMSGSGSVQHPSRVISGIGLSRRKTRVALRCYERIGILCYSKILGILSRIGDWVCLMVLHAGLCINQSQHHPSKLSTWD